MRFTLRLQVARFLMKTVSQAQRGNIPSGTAAYFGNLRQLMTDNCKVTKGKCLFVMFLAIDLRIQVHMCVCVWMHKS